MIGPGKFDDLCTLVREQANAIGAIVIVIESPAGSGFSVQAPVDVHASLPTLLRLMADEIERS